MRNRVTAQDEQVRCYASASEADQATFLRRKVEQGKAMPRTPKPTPKP
jgi:hypothetical protein